MVAGMILFSPIVLFPSFLGEKLSSIPKSAPGQITKIFSVWGGRNRSTPGTYRQLLGQTLRKATDVTHTPDTIQDGAHVFDQKSVNILTSLLPLVVPR